MITKDSIEQLVHCKENEKIAFKMVLPPSKVIAQFVSAFANTNGGYLVLGIQNKSGGNNEIKGISGDFYATDTTHKAIDLLTPKPIVNHGYVTIQGKKIFVISVEKSEKKILLQGQEYVRINSSTKLVIKEKKDVTAKFNEYSRITEIKEELENYIESSTEAKTIYFEHLISLLSIIYDLGEILYPEKPEIATTNQEGKILCRILYSSMMDNFETYLSDLLYEIFLAKPNTLISKELVTVEEILKCSNLQEFVKYWAKQKIGKLQKGSVLGFVDENKQIKDLKIIDKSEIVEIEKLLQIRHLYSHRNGIVDEKFQRSYSNSFELNTEHKLAISEICDKMYYLIVIVNKLDEAAKKKYKIGM